MTNGDLQLELALELARRAREPSAADEARNLAALRARLALPGAPVANPSTANASSESANSASANSASASAARGLSRESSSGLWRLIGASTFTGVAGFLLGLLLAPSLRLAPSESSDLARAPGLVERASDDRGRAAAQLEPNAGGHAVAADAAPARAVEAPSTGEPQSSSLPQLEAEAAGKPRTARHAPPRARAVHRPKVTANGPDFLEAVRWLRRAQRAERRGEAALALGLLEQIDERFPPELLGEERQATRVLGLCGTGEPERARALALELLAKSPRSIYAERLRASCAAPALGGDDKENDPGARE